MRCSEVSDYRCAKDVELLPLHPLPQGGGCVFRCTGGDAGDLQVVAGQDAIKKYRPGADWRFERCFCRECGTSPGDMATGDIYVVAASALDDVRQFDGDLVPDA